jgi:aminopeptidase
MGAFESFLGRYAEVAVRVGANVQPGQSLTVIAGVDHVPLARAVARAGWEAGAADVQLVCYGHYERYLLARHGAEATLDRTTVIHRALLEYELEAGGSSVAIVGDEAPAFFADADPTLLARTVPREGIELTQRLMNEDRSAWTVIGYPEAGWAQKVFGEPDVDRLVGEISAACRLDDADPVASWRKHLDVLEQRAAALDAARIDHIHIRGPHTDLEVGLLPESRWITGRHRTRWGQGHCVNMPTEEVFTTPDRQRVDGTVAATRPIAREGVVVDGIRLELSEGRITRATATTGEDSLREQLATDEGAGRLGELALVAGSRVGARNLLFFNTLFDENATSHLAYGMAYTAAVEGADALSPEEQLTLGINQSHVHVDFPVGGPDVEIDAVSADGTSRAVIRGDDWVLPV